MKAFLLILSIRLFWVVVWFSPKLLYDVYKILTSQNEVSILIDMNPEYDVELWFNNATVKVMKPNSEYFYLNWKYQNSIRYYSLKKLYIIAIFKRKDDENKIKNIWQKYLLNLLENKFLPK